MQLKIKDILQSRILVLDGAMGTMIQRYNLTEEQYKGERFKSATKLQQGNIDLLTLSQPHIIESIHREYLEAGADIIETNTFNANSISMKEYGMQKYVNEINIEAATMARKLADDFTNKNSNKPRFVAGAVGPTNKITTINQEREEAYSVDFDELRISYQEQIEALIKGGVDIILIETIFDTLNAKAALFATQDIFRKTGKEVPIIISITLSENKIGDTCSGESIEEFINSLDHIKLFSVGLNCSFGAHKMKTHLKQLRNISPLFITAYPNAGLPNKKGQYNETPDILAAKIKEFVDEGLVNIVGGCCGTTPCHIAKIAEVVNGVNPLSSIK